MTDRPGPHPEPHSNLDTRNPVIRQLAVGTKLFRLHRRLRSPLFFGKTGNNRFDSPDGKFGVLYAGMDAHCAFIETFGQTTGVQVVSGSMLAARHISQIELLRPLQLIDLSTSGSLARVGADMRLLSGSHAIAQRWSERLRDHPVKPDGILYPARHDPARNSCAIFERAATDFRIVSSGSFLDLQNQTTLAAILDCYEFGLILEE